MSADAMAIGTQVVHLEDEVWVRVSGEVDLATAPVLTDLVQTSVDASTRRVVLDLCDVGFLDSSGLAMIVDIRNGLHERGGALALRSPSDSVRKLLAITRIDEI